MTIAVESDNIKQLLYSDVTLRKPTLLLRTRYKKAPVMITGAANKPDYV